MKTIGAVAPWAIVLTGAGGAVWWLLSRDIAAGRWLLAALLFGHGAVHLLFVVPPPDGTDAGSEWPFDMTRSWTITGPALDPDTVRAAGKVLVAGVVAGFALAALSTTSIVVPPGWWRATVASSSIASAAALVLFLSPRFVLGLGMDVALVWVAAAGAWMP
jgi:hypothetical protein